MSQKFFSLSDRFTIKDEQDRDAYYVKGKVFSAVVVDLVCHSDNRRR